MLFTECEYFYANICLHPFVKHISTSTFLWPHHCFHFQDLKFSIFFWTPLASSKLLHLFSQYAQIRFWGIIFQSSKGIAHGLLLLYYIIFHLLSPVLYYVNDRPLYYNSAQSRFWGVLSICCTGICRNLRYFIKPQFFSSVPQCAHDLPLCMSLPHPYRLCSSHLRTSVRGRIPCVMCFLFYTAEGCNTETAI